MLPFHAVHVFRLLMMRASVASTLSLRSRSFLPSIRDLDMTMITESSLISIFSMFRSICCGSAQLRSVSKHAISNGIQGGITTGKPNADESMLM